MKLNSDLFSLNEIKFFILYCFIMESITKCSFMFQTQLDNTAAGLRSAIGRAPDL